VQCSWGEVRTAALQECEEERRWRVMGINWIPLSVICLRMQYKDEVVVSLHGSKRRKNSKGMRATCKQMQKKTPTDVYIDTVMYSRIYV